MKPLIPILRKILHPYAPRRSRSRPAQLPSVSPNRTCTVPRQCYVQYRGDVCILTTHTTPHPPISRPRENPPLPFPFHSPHAPASVFPLLCFCFSSFFPSVAARLLIIEQYFSFLSPAPLLSRAHVAPSSSITAHTSGEPNAMM